MLVMLVDIFARIFEFGDSSWIFWLVARVVIIPGIDMIVYIGLVLYKKYLFSFLTIRM